MTDELLTTLVLLGSAVVMFAVNRPRMDAVALLMMTTLPLLGLIDLDEALAGFSDPNVVLIAALFVVGDGLARTGVAQRIGDWLIGRAGRSEGRLIVILMVMVAGIGAFMSSTGVVAIFIPVVLRVASNANLSPSRLMMPLSMAALLSGMMTLVATAPNLVVNGELVRHGFEGFHFFSFTPFGLPLLGLALLYMLRARRWLGEADESIVEGDKPRLATWIEEYGLAKRELRVRVAPRSPLVGGTLADLDLRASTGVNILAIERARRFATELIRPLPRTELIQPRASTRIEAGDVLLLDVVDSSVEMKDLCDRFALVSLPLSGAYYSDRSQEIGMAEVMIPATSKLIGRTVLDARFRSAHNLTVVGLKRGREARSDAIVDEKLQLGDTLLVIGPWRRIRALMLDMHELVVLGLPAELDDVVPVASRAPYALLSLTVVVALMVSGVVPNLLAALIGCLLLGLFGCIDMSSAYRSIHWQSLILIVGMLPFSMALQKHGGVDLVAQGVIEVVGDASPRAVLAGLFATTAILGLFISNTATAVLMAPIALAIADGLGASPYPFAMTVALAASAAFMTPISSPVNTLVVSPGRYSFFDFVRIGVPFTLITLATCVVLVPWLLPP